MRMLKYLYIVFVSVVAKGGVYPMTKLTKGKIYCYVFKMNRRHCFCDTAIYYVVLY